MFIVLRFKLTSFVCLKDTKLKNKNTYVVVVAGTHFFCNEIYLYYISFVYYLSKVNPLIGKKLYYYHELNLLF